MNNLVGYLMLLVVVLVGVAFITLMERKILGVAQLRVGPSKPSVWGLLQPISDAIKLFTKTFSMGLSTHKYVFFGGPGVALLLVLFIWMVNSKLAPGFSFEYGILLMLLVLSLNVYPMMLSGWASSSKYTMFGSLRSVSQSISYEISLAFILLVLIIVYSTISLSFLPWGLVSGVWLTPFLLGMWVVSALAESNRTPFDFAEGESELVSGFNTEYGGGGFALIFMAEYGSIFFLAGLTTLFLIPQSNLIVYGVVTTAVVFGWVWVRSTFPRYRYDLLMGLAWKSLLPLTISYLIYFLSI